MPRFALLLLFPGLLAAQNISSTLSGNVKDATGAPIPAAAIALTETETGIARNTRTNADGFFSYPDLRAASYKLEIAHPGFKRYEQTAIDLSSSEQRSLGEIRLALGQLTETVEVTAEVNPVMLSSGERTGSLTGQDIQNMALRGRDFMDSVGLLPGVVDIASSRESPSADSLKSIYILGSRENAKNMTVDGISSVDAGNSAGVMVMPSMDAVGEMKVLMSNYSAENGRKSGGTISVITRGGGRVFHGSAGWYHRHEGLNANNYFNNRNGLARPLYRYNIASYTIGGPIYIPGKFNKDRSKLFFFWSQEFQRQLVNYGAKTVRVPTALERTGDFSQTMDVNGKLVPVRDALNNQTQFPNNTVPKSRISQVGANVLNLFPLPNFVDPLPSRRYQWNYISAQSAGYPRDSETLRVDYSASSRFQLYGRFSRTGDNQALTYGMWINGGVNFPLTPIVFPRPSQGGLVRGAMTFSPTMFNEFSAGLTRNTLNGNPLYPEKVSRKATGIDVPMWNPASNPAGFIPNMSFSGVPNAANASMNNPMPYYTDCNIYSFTDNLSKVWGSHMLKFGVYFERMAKDQFAGVASRGNVAFDVDRNNPLDSNHAYANALTGVYASYNEASAIPLGLFRFNNLELYAQDTWRVSGRLTLDFGARFYHDSPMYDQNNQLSSFVPGFWQRSAAPVLLRPAYDASKVKVALDPTTGITYPQAYIGTFAPGVGNSANGMAQSGKNGISAGLYTTPFLNFAPRLGFAWDPFGRQKTSVRGGIGIFFDRIAGNPTIATLGNPPTVYNPRVYYGTLDSLTATQGKRILAPSNVNSLFGESKTPATYNFSFGIQHQISRTTLFDISYVGSISRHLLWQRNINPIPIGATHLNLNPQNADPTTTAALANNFLRPYQGYGDLLMYEFASTSNYHSLQAAVNRRMARGLSIGASYTFGKVLGTAETDNTTVSPFFNPRHFDYGPMNFDRSQVFSARYTWVLPKPGRRLHLPALGVATDGWEISGITRAMTGAPFTPGFSLVSGLDITGTASQGARVVVVNPAAPTTERFGPPARDTFGNAGNGLLRLPGLYNWDLSLYRRIAITEKIAAQLRLESYNTFNHTQFSNVLQTARFDNTGAQVDPLFLQPTAARDARRVQLAVRVTW